MDNDASPELTLKTYTGPWVKKGPLLFACRKCMRKLRHEKHQPLAGFKKLLKKRGKKLGFPQKLRVIDTPCLSVCPRGGVTICTQAQMGRGECSILRQPGDVDLLVLHYIHEAAVTP
jgi:hypothetical protein